jgi:hypothetical protein
MPIRLSTGAATKVLDTGSLKTLLTACFIDIYSGTQPTLPDDVPSGTKLVTIYSNGTSTGLGWGTAVAGVLPKATAETWSGTVLANGTAGWFRIREASDAGTASSTTAVRIDGNIATSGADMNLGSLSLTLGAPFQLTSAQLTLPQT